MAEPEGREAGDTNSAEAWETDSLEEIMAKAREEKDSLEEPMAMETLEELTDNA